MDHGNKRYIKTGRLCIQGNEDRDEWQAVFFWIEKLFGRLDEKKSRRDENSRRGRVDNNDGTRVENKNIWRERWGYTILKHEVFLPLAWKDIDCCFCCFSSLVKFFSLFFFLTTKQVEFSLKNKRKRNANTLERHDQSLPLTGKGDFVLHSWIYPTTPSNDPWKTSWTRWDWREWEEDSVSVTHTLVKQRTWRSTKDNNTKDKRTFSSSNERKDIKWNRMAKGNVVKADKNKRDTNVILRFQLNTPFMPSKTINDTRHSSTINSLLVPLDNEKHRHRLVYQDDCQDEFTENPQHDVLSIQSTLFFMIVLSKRMQSRVRNNPRFSQRYNNSSFRVLSRIRVMRHNTLRTRTIASFQLLCTKAWLTRGSAQKFLDTSLSLIFVVLQWLTLSDKHLFC